jgi:hypothetical protein
MAKVQLPPDWDINNSAAVLSDDPEEIYKEWDYLREKCPVARVDRHNGYWMLTKYCKRPLRMIDTVNFDN